MKQVKEKLEFSIKDLNYMKQDQIQLKMSIYQINQSIQHIIMNYMN